MSTPQNAIPAPPDTVFTVSSPRIQIRAPASHVFRTILDTSTWPKWNTFVPKCTIDEQPRSSPKNENVRGEGDTQREEILRVGTKMTFHVQMKPGPSLVKQKQVVTEIATPPPPPSPPGGTPGVVELVTDTEKRERESVYRIVWHSRAFPTSLLRAVRTQEIRDVGDGGAESGECEYVTWEHFAGPMAWMVKWMYERTLGVKFGDWAGDLRGWCEWWWRKREREDG